MSESTCADLTGPAAPAVWSYAACREWLDARGVEFPQHAGEFSWLLGHVRELRPATILEVGSRAGGSLFALAMQCPRPALAVSVDLPGARWGYESSRESLLRVAEALGEGGVRTGVVLGDSHSPETLGRAREALEGRPLDFAFIDGDHTYEGARQDWEWYGSLVRPGGLVAFHDIWVPDDFPDKTFGVPRLWGKIRESHETIERIEQWGIGIVRIAS